MAMLIKSLFDKSPNAKSVDKSDPLPGRTPSEAFKTALSKVEKLVKRPKSKK